MLIFFLFLNNIWILLQSLVWDTENSIEISIGQAALEPYWLYYFVCLINYSRTTWSTKISIPFLSLSENLLQDNPRPIVLSKQFWLLWDLYHTIRGWFWPRGGGFLENICTGMLKVDFRMLTIYRAIPMYCKKNTRSLYTSPVWLNQPISIPFLLKWWPIIIIFISKTAHCHTITEIRGH